MLGVALTAQRAGWGEVPAQALITARSIVQYENYQTPAYSLNLGIETILDNEIDITGYTSLPGYGARRATLMFNWRGDWDSGLSTNEYLGNIGRIHVISPDQSQDWFIYCAANTGFESPPGLRLTFGMPSINLDYDFPGSYEDWQQRWLLFVISTSSTSGDFTDWQPQPGYNSGNTYFRLCIFDQETGELVVKRDYQMQEDAFPDLSTMSDPLLIVNPYDTEVDGVDVRIFNGGPAGSEENVGWNRTSTYWTSYGTMFDPLDPDITDYVWLSTRPDKDILSARAWINVPYTESVTAAAGSYLRYYVKTSGDDLYSDPTAANRAFGRTSNENQTWTDNPAESAENYWPTVSSTTIIPKTGNF